MRFWRLYALVSVLLFCVFFASASWAQEAAFGDLLFSVRIPAEVGAMATIATPAGETFEIGKVRAVPTKSRYPGFTASKYGLGGQIIATAANAHHVQISTEQGEGRTISVLPSQTFVASAGMGTSFIIEGLGGNGLWGRYAPFVGSPVYIVNATDQKILFNDWSLYKYAKAIVIDVYESRPSVDYIEIENWAGGKAWYHESNGRDHPFGLVETGVTATGRFEGSLYQGPSMIRANHTAVICVSTTERGDIGGFQIVPVNHTYSKEMQKTRNMGQYIVLRGTDFENLTGRFPFFWGAVRPGDDSAPGYNGGRVLCRMKGKWQDLPVVSGKTEDTLKDVEAIRILLK